MRSSLPPSLPCSVAYLQELTLRVLESFIQIFVTTHAFTEENFVLLAVVDLQAL